MIVIQEIFGVNDVVRAICDAHAARGRFALAPDLFWRLEPGVELTDKTQEDWGKAFGYMQRFDVDTGVIDIQTSIAHLRKVPGCTGKIGTVGYCLGGQLAFLAGTRTDADAQCRLLRRHDPKTAERSRQDQEAADAAHRGQGRLSCRRKRARRSSTASKATRS